MEVGRAAGQVRELELPAQSLQQNRTYKFHLNDSLFEGHLYANHGRRYFINILFNSDYNPTWQAWLFPFHALKNWGSGSLEPCPRSASSLWRSRNWIERSCFFPYITLSHPPISKSVLAVPCHSEVSECLVLGAYNFAGKNNLRLHSDFAWKERYLCYPQYMFEFTNKRSMPSGTQGSHSVVPLLNRKLAFQGRVWVPNIVLMWMSLFCPGQFRLSLDKFKDSVSVPSTSRKHLHW